MNGRLLISMALVAAVGLGAAYGLGLFDPPTLSTPAADIDASAAPPTSRPEPPEPAERVEPAEAAGSAPPAEPPVVAPTTATLRIDSDVRGADVFIDNAFVGRTPAVIEGVAPGTRKINVSAEGYETVGGFHEIAPGSAELSIPVKVIRLDRRVAVRHKHGVGACEGTLSATPEGLRYETTRTEDAFRAPLTSLQTFEADYLQKNLKVATGGRTYNFTVAGGTADDLYGFYQDVEKVRQRLSEGGGDD